MQHRSREAKHCNSMRVVVAYFRVGGELPFLQDFLSIYVCETNRAANSMLSLVVLAELLTPQKHDDRVVYDIYVYM